MSVAGIVSTLASLSSPSYQNPFQGKLQTFKNDLKTLGQDLQSGNLTQAQADFATLQKDAPPGLTGTQGSAQNPIASAFSKLSQDLQSGNLTAAQSDYQTLSQDLQKVGARYHHHRVGGDSGQLFAQLGQSLQSGNLSGAQQAYTSLLQEFQNAGGGGSTSSGTATSSSVNATA